MKGLLFTGNGTSGSWKIRGEQLGTALGATVIPRVTEVKDFAAAVVVKRCPPETLRALQVAGIPIVWDVVDSWPQPQGNTWTRDECLVWLNNAMKTIRPFAVVAATKHMQQDLNSFGIPCLFLPHHARPNQPINPVRERVETVGYEGGNYLGSWEPFLKKECLRRKWRFVINPTALADLDIVVAVRGVNGYAPSNWKSGVKLSNAQGSGTPFIGNPENGYTAQAVGSCEKWAESQKQMVRAMTSLEYRVERQRCSWWMRAAAPTLERVSAAYKDWLIQEVLK